VCGRGGDVVADKARMRRRRREVMRSGEQEDGAKGEWRTGAWDSGGGAKRIRVGAGKVTLRGNGTGAAVDAGAAAGQEAAPM
jgi:hypothetical protein